MANGDGFLPPINVKSVRNKIGMTQKRFCEAFGINLNTLRHWEKGDRAPQGTSLILLHLIENSPKEVYEALVKATLDLTSVGLSEKMSMKELIANNRYENLYDFLIRSNVPADAVLVEVIKAAGISYCKSDKVDDLVVLHAGYDRENMKDILFYNVRDRKLSGELVGLVEKTFIVISAIENELSDAMYLPHEMRQKQIGAFLEEFSVDVVLYKTVLKNW